MDERRPVTIELDARAIQRVDRAARLLRQTPSAFLAGAVEAVARQVVLEDAAERWLREEGTYSELAAETGLWVEEIMQAVSRRNSERAVEASLEHSQALAEDHHNPTVLRLAQEATATVRTWEIGVRGAGADPRASRAAAGESSPKAVTRTS